MYEETFSIHCYKEVDRYISSFENKQIVTTAGWLGYSTGVIKSRLVQKVTSIITTPFLQYALNKYENGNKGTPSLDEKVELGGLKISSETKIQPSINLYFKNFVLFLSLWSYVLIKGLKFCKPNNTRYEQSTILYGVPDAELRHNGSDERFCKFIFHGPISILHSSSSIFVQAASEINSTKPKYLHYSKHPLLDLFSKVNCSLSERIAFLISHFITLINGIYLFVRCPLLVLLWRDFAEHAVANHLNSRGIIKNVIITNTNWIQQLLWMSDLPNRKYKLHMALYSQNSDLINYKKEPMEEVSHPCLRHLHVDNIFIWEDDYTNTLKKIGISSKTTTVGPILWYLPEENKCVKNSKSLKISVFDVTPMHTAALKKRGLLKSYYNLENSIMFIDDLVAAANITMSSLNCNINIILKHKRMPHAGHDETYFQHIALLEESGDIEIESSDINVYSLLESTDASVVIPFSSAAYVSHACDKPAIFYDPSSEVIGAKYTSENLFFISGRENLAGKLKEILYKN